MWFRFVDCVCFFYTQKTAYELRISNWNSDVCSSDQVKPIDFRAGNVTIRVEGTAEHGIATIWDADVLIWAASQIVEAKDAGLRPSRLMRATPYETIGRAACRERVWQ